jgi:uncharacterized Zn finger protein
MPLFDEGPLVTGRRCPQCHDEQLQMILVTDDALYLRCLTCGCVWHEKDQRTPLRIRIGGKPAESRRD